MNEFNLKSISPIDGRYSEKCFEVSKYFSEYALIKYRVYIEIEYFKALCKTKIEKLNSISSSQIKKIDSIVSKFSIQDALKIKEIEKKINHDVKAVEYFIKEKFEDIGLSKFKEFIHFGLTSQDINNTATPLMLKECVINELIPTLEITCSLLEEKIKEFSRIPMIARTHGQPATPTVFGKEINVFLERLKIQIQSLLKIPNNGKFGGASGNLNAHYIAYPNINWDKFSDDFLKNIGLIRSKPTTQIEHYDNMAAIFHNIIRINTIMIDFNRDIWHYISISYLKQKIIKNEVGSSAMPHKVNPIDFENAEGNLMLANSLFSFLSEKLPISRLQRDLTDSTVSRNIGLPIAYTILAHKSLSKGIKKLDVDINTINKDLNNNWAVVSEAIQTILRRENIPNPYELLKDLTRGNTEITKDSILKFINNLPVNIKIKKELNSITPNNYLGNSNKI
jgi:adenylosuccinate lyase